MDILNHNRKAWNKESENGSEWSVPVSAEVMLAAKNDDWSVILTPNAAVPREWFGDLKRKRVLGLASGGGQQVPIFAAAGAEVTSFDLSDIQLSKDKEVADREGLKINCIRGDMADLSVFTDGYFDLIFHPISNVFAPEIEVVWRECYRVLKRGGRLLAGFMNPAFYLFDHEEALDCGKLEARYKLPFSDEESLPESKKNELLRNLNPLEYSHTLNTQIGGQLRAGFVLSGFYEDNWSDEATLLNKFMPVAIATLAIKQ